MTVENYENLFKDEISALDKELDDLNELYKELKTNYDNIISTRNRGTLAFNHQQSTNLVSLRSNILNVIKEKARIKKMIADLDIKKDNKEEFDKTTQTISAIFDELAKSKVNNHSSLNSDEPDVDLLLEQRLEEEFEEKEEEKEEINFVTDENGILYAVNSNYEVLSYDIPKKWFVDFKEENEEIKAFLIKEDGSKTEIDIVE